MDGDRLIEMDGDDLIYGSFAILLFDSCHICTLPLFLLLLLFADYYGFFLF